VNSVSRETYFDNFFAVRPVAYYPVPRQTILDKKEVIQSFEDAGSGTGGQFYSGARSGYVLFFESIQRKYENRRTFLFEPGLYSHVRVSAMIKSSPASAPHENLVLDFKRMDSTVSYQVWIGHVYF
jgi:hypothetical protein